MMLMPLCTWAAKQGYAVFDSNTGTLTFKYGEKPSGDNVYDTDATGYLPKWYDYGKGICAQIKKVVFDESFNEARPTSTNSWFNGAKELTEIVDIKNLNTDEVTNMASMFFYCQNLETVDLENFNTSKVTDMNRMFSSCISLTSLDLSGFNVGNVTNMEYMFSGLSNLTELNLGDFDASNVKTFYYMFWGNSNLTKIEATSFTTEKATNYHSMFDGCKSLTSIDVSKFNTSQATDLSDLFDGCTNLKELDLSNFDTSNATNISNMFYKCTSLTSINLSSFNTANVTSIGGMFKGCESLKELDLKHFNTENVKGMGAMFEDCKSLESLDIKNFNTSKCFHFEEMFSRCESLKSLDVTNFNTENAENMRGMFAGCFRLTELDVTNFVTNNVTNMQSMFAYCRGLEKLDLTRFDTGNVTAMSSMFMDCKSLTTLDLSSFNTENVTGTNYMFYNCEKLTTIYISDKWSTNSITTSLTMFFNCKQLKGQDGTTYDENKRDATYAHANAGGYMTMKSAAEALNEGDSFTVDGITYSVIDAEELKVQVGKGGYDVAYDTEFTGTLNIPFSVSGPDGKSYTVTAIASYAFYRCKLSGVTLPNTLEEIGVSSFRECRSMTSINFPSSLIAISTEAFAECKLLTTISIPASVRYISINAFQSCSGIASMVVDPDNKVYDSRDNCNAIIETKSNTLVFGCQNTVIPNTVTTIAERSFFGCETLKAISFPNSVTSIESHAFYKCTGLTSITIPSSLTDLGDNPFAWCSGLESVTVEEGNTTFDTRDNCNAIIRTANNELVIGCKNSTISETVKIIGPSAFYYCEDITSVTLPDGLTEIADEAFVGCRLTSVTFPSSLKRIGVWAFQGCPFGSLDIPGNVTEIGRLAFSWCNLLTTITLPNSLTTIGESAFSYSNNITTINSQIVNPEAINDNVFSEQVYEKATLNVPSGSKDKYQSVDGWKKFANITETGFSTTAEPYAVLSEDNTVLTFYYDDQKEARGGTIFSLEGHEWSSNNKDIVTVRFDNSFTNYTGVTSTDMWFCGCEKLTTIEDIKNLKTGNVTNMSNMFSLCEALTEIDLSAFDTRNVTDMNHMFYSCYGLTSLELEYLNTEKVTNMAYMFFGVGLNSPSLNTLDFSNFNTSKVTTMRSMFGFSNFTSLDLSSFDTSNVTDMGYMFAFCPSLESINLSSFNTSLVTDMFGMFDDCKSLASIDLSKFDTRNVTATGEMFRGCMSLTSIDLSSFDTNNVEDMGSMFGRTEDLSCANLETIFVGKDWTTKNVKSSANMFLGCVKLVGQDGTKYEESKVDATFAHAGEGGYMTYKEAELEPMKESEEVTFKESGKITEETSLSGTVIDNVYYNISSSDGHFDAEEGCLVVTKTMSDEDVEAVLGKDLMSDDVKQTFAGIVIEVPAGKGKVTVNAETTGGMTLKVKIGNLGAVKLKFDGKTKMKVPYNVSEPTYVYIYAAKSAAQARERIAKDGDEPSVKIYGIGIEPKTLLLGDADDDETVDVNDVVCIVNHILKKTADIFNAEAADVNNDGSIDVADVVATVNIILGKTSEARSKVNVFSAETENDHLFLTGNERDGYSLSLNNAGRYQAAQFDIRLANSLTLEAVSLNMMRCGNHQMAYAKIGEGLYRILMYNIGGEAFDGNDGELLRMSVAGSGDLTVSDIKFVTDAQAVRHFAPLSAGTTGINAIILLESPADIYSLDGRLVRKQATNTEGLKKGLYIVNGQKMYIK